MNNQDMEDYTLLREFLSELSTQKKLQRIAASRVLLKQQQSGKAVPVVEQKAEQTTENPSLYEQSLKTLEQNLFSGEIQQLLQLRLSQESAEKGSSALQIVLSALPNLQANQFKLRHIVAGQHLIEINCPEHHYNLILSGAVNLAFEYDLTHSEQQQQQQQHKNLKKKHRAKGNKVLEAGMGFGEISIITDSHAVYSAVCVQEGILLEITQHALTSAQHNIARQIANKWIESLQLLQSFSFFNGLPDRIQTALLLYEGSVRHLRNSTLLYDEGWRANKLYFLIDGEIELSEGYMPPSNHHHHHHHHSALKNQKLHPFVIKTGASYFGEEEVLLGVNRRTTRAVVKSEFVNFIEINSEAFKYYAHKNNTWDDFCLESERLASWKRERQESLQSTSVYFSSCLGSLEDVAVSRRQSQQFIAPTISTVYETDEVMQRNFNGFQSAQNPQNSQSSLQNSKTNFIQKQKAKAVIQNYSRKFMAQQQESALLKKVEQIADYQKKQPSQVDFTLINSFEIDEKYFLERQKESVAARTGAAPPTQALVRQLFGIGEEENNNQSQQQNSMGARSVSLVSLRPTQLVKHVQNPQLCLKKLMAAFNYKEEFHKQKLQSQQEIPELTVSEFKDSQIYPQSSLLEQNTVHIQESLNSKKVLFTEGTEYFSERVLATPQNFKSTISQRSENMTTIIGNQSLIKSNSQLKSTKNQNSQENLLPPVQSSSLSTEAFNSDARNSMNNLRLSPIVKSHNRQLLQKFVQKFGQPGGVSEFQIVKTEQSQKNHFPTISFTDESFVIPIPSQRGQQVPRHQKKARSVGGVIGFSSLQINSGSKKVFLTPRLAQLKFISHFRKKLTLPNPIRK